MKQNRTLHKASGRWSWIFTELGIPDSYLTGAHGPCPKCGGDDRYRYTNYRNNGDYFCNGCGPGDGFDIIMAVRDCPFKEAARLVDEVIQNGDPEEDEPFSPEKSIEQRRATLNKTWAGAKPSHKIDQYLGSRGIDTDKLPDDFDRDLRWHPSLWLAEENAEVPAMIALIRNWKMEPISIHRTFMVGKHKKIMPPTEKITGGCIHLGNTWDTGKLIVGEGIETVLAAMAYFSGVPGVAAISAGNMEGYLPPRSVRKVYVVADHDQSFTGQKAAFTLARQLDQRKIRTAVLIPEAPESDFNDLIKDAGQSFIMFDNFERHKQ